MGCSQPETGSEAQPEKAPEETYLLIGLIPEHNIFKQLERYEPLAGYLAKKIGTKIKLKLLTRYGNIVDNFVSLGLDAAFFGSFTYALAHAKIGVQAIARPENNLGVSTYHGLIFVRKDSGIVSAKDMKGKTFAFVDKATTAGYILPLAYFKKNEIEDYKTFFKETYFTGTHEDAIYDVLNKKADIGAAKNTVFFRISVDDSRVTQELNIIARSPDVPENGLAVRKHMNKSLKVKLKQALLTMHQDPAGIKILRDFGAQRFIATTNKDYTNVYLYAHLIGLDLRTYDYMNE